MRVQENAMGSVFERYGLQKLSDLDVARLQALMPGVELGEEANTLKFKTPGGHAVTTPYARDVIEHQVKRLGGAEPYHAALAKRLQDEGVGVDRDVEREREEESERGRTGKTLGYGLLGGTAGALLGALAKKPEQGAVIGGLVGALGGGILGHSRPLERTTGPTSKHLDEISELYKEPEHVKHLKSQLHDLQGDVDDLRYRRRYNYGYYGPYGHYRHDPLYGYGY